MADFLQQCHMTKHIIGATRQGKTINSCILAEDKNKIMFSQILIPGFINKALFSIIASCIIN